MLELRPARVGVVKVLGDPEAIDAAGRPEDGMVRIAADEALIVCDPSRELRIAEALSEQLSRTGSSLVVADGDSFAPWALLGSAIDEAIGRLSAIALPRQRPAFVQGLVADLPAKVLLGDDRALLLVPSTAGHHLLRRATAACEGFGVRVGSSLEFDPAAWPNARA